MKDGGIYFRISASLNYGHLARLHGRAPDPSFAIGDGNPADGQRLAEPVLHAGVLGEAIRYLLTHPFDPIGCVRCQHLSTGTGFGSLR